MEYSCGGESPVHLHVEKYLVEEGYKCDNGAISIASADFEPEFDSLHIYPSSNLAILNVLVTNHNSTDAPQAVLATLDAPGASSGDDSSSTQTLVIYDEDDIESGKSRVYNIAFGVTDGWIKTMKQNHLTSDSSETVHTSITVDPYDEIFELDEINNTVEKDIVTSNTQTDIQFFE